MDRDVVDSSMIESIGYDQSTGTLESGVSVEQTDLAILRCTRGHLL